MDHVQAAACLAAISAEECLLMRMRHHFSVEAVAGEDAQPGVHQSTFHAPSTPVHAWVMALYPYVSSGRVLATGHTIAV